ncbi:deoxyribonuclease 1 like 4, tandem duplicate 1 [Chiloscyllium plagiosum]|uniref:deoxyribonuclease 1 like 4, tandem duplicate 1 n=1 Tax=Chiloscyllium plagiosum TaxID=36176 RepID=UPI001CB86E7C|nr:deoxyribonuclease 1 like 4, tandem duplicate 1 [Chiloscyllium plagiosum]XP_043564508.1 deoxyribonuclease 1 like 4, tandem duplicate 1 [Chiloscyllium plagiosum]XP_043564509.1 deoxyribonuclease 1 like 4, tandem duplicate 1 [Chiloscyllium plagiosum]
MKIAAFNIQRLGTSKISKPNVVSTIVNILLRYDITLIMEVTDKSEKATKRLMEELNRQAVNHYSFVISKPLGRASYKEQYLFVYRDDIVEVKRVFQYEDMQLGDEDAFSREPFVIQFKSRTTVVKNFVLIPQHTCPEDSVKEIDELYDVFLKIKEKWKVKNFMILGDFNADGRYVSKDEMKNIRLRTDNNFHWLIGDDEDTTTNAKTDRAYDRIVVYGDWFYKQIVPNSAKPFNFQEELHLSEEQALDVSDHYPVEVELKLRNERN